MKEKKQVIELGKLRDKIFELENLQEGRNPQQYIQDEVENGNINELTSYFLLGYCYDRGIGVERDSDKKIEYYQRATKNNQADSFLLLGYCFEKGIGTEQNLDNAHLYYSHASKIDNLAQYFMNGFCYECGIGSIVEGDRTVEIKQDYVLAYEYYHTVRGTGDKEIPKQDGRLVSELVEQKFLDLTGEITQETEEWQSAGRINFEPDMGNGHLVSELVEQKFPDLTGKTKPETEEWRSVENKQTIRRSASEPDMRKLDKSNQNQNNEPKSLLSKKDLETLKTPILNLVSPPKDEEFQLHGDSVYEGSTSSSPSPGSVQSLTRSPVNQR